MGAQLTPPFLHARPISLYTIVARTEGSTHAAKVVGVVPRSRANRNILVADVPCCFATGESVGAGAGWLVEKLKSFRPVKEDSGVDEFGRKINPFARRRTTLTSNKLLKNAMERSTTIKSLNCRR